MFLEEFKKLELKKEFAGVRLPQLQIDQKYYSEVGISPDSSNLNFLKALAYKGFKELLVKGKIDKNKQSSYIARAKEEIETFAKLSFVDYVLIVWDVVNFCKERDIPVGIGRGSVCGSLIFYLIGVTGIDPLLYDLYFQRFVSEARAKSQTIDGELYIDGSLMCDVDLDVDHSRRAEVVGHLNTKYPNRIVKIINLSTLTGKNLIKECGKIVAEKSEYEMNQVSEMVLQIFGQVQDVEKIYKESKEFKAWCDKNKEAYDISLRLRDLIKNKSVHASGIVISHDPIEDTCPLELTNQGELVSGFDMKDITKFCIKLDVLGLKTLTIINDVCTLAGIKMEDINYNDPQIYAFLQDFKFSYGIFQLEGATVEKGIKIVKPQNLEELSAVQALARPGAMHFINEYADNKNQGYFKKTHPIFDPILAATHGVPIYQEQLMKMANAVGFTLDESEVLRRIVGKKDREAVNSWKERIFNKVKENNHPTKLGDLLWDVLFKSKDYSFNKSHSIAYSALAAITIYLKINYPKEFFYACLKIAKTEQDKNEKILKIVNEMQWFQLKLLPPNLSLSKDDFTLEKNGIRYGLSSIKGVSEKALEHLRQFNIEGFNKFELFESAKRSKINIGVLSALIQAGALGEFPNITRSKLVLEAQLWSLLTQREKLYCLKNGESNQFELVEMVRDIMSWVDEQEKPVARKTRLKTIGKKYEGYKAIYNQNSQNEDFANWWYERHLLGFTYSSSLKQIFSRADANLVSVQEFNDFNKDQRGTVVGLVEKAADGTTKNKKRYSKFFVEDGTGSLMAFAFDGKNGETGKRTELRALNRLPKEGEVAAFRGRKWENMLIIEDTSPQNYKIFIKLADLKNDK